MALGRLAAASCALIVGGTLMRRPMRSMVTGAIRTASGSRSRARPSSRRRAATSRATTRATSSRYVVPPVDPDAGQTVFMTLVNEDTVHLRIGATPSYSSGRDSAGLAPLRPADELTPNQDTPSMPDDSLSPRPQQTAPVGWEPELAELRARIALAKEMGGADRVARQHAGRPAHRPRADRPHAGSRQLPRDRRDRRQGDLRRRQQADRRLHAGQLRVRPRHGRWAAGGDRRRRLHAARRVGGRLDQGQAEDVGADRGRVPHADHPADRRLRRRRLGEDDRDHRARQPAGRAVGDHLVRPGGEQHGDGAGRGAGAGFGRRAGRGAAGGQPLLGDGEGDVRGVRRRPAGGGAAGRAAHQAGTRRLGRAACLRRGGPRGGHRGRGVRGRAAVPVVSAGFDLGRAAAGAQLGRSGAARRVPDRRDPAREEAGLPHAPDHRGAGGQGQLLRDGRACSAGRSSPGSAGWTAGRWR